MIFFLVCYTERSISGMYSDVIFISFLGASPAKIFKSQSKIQFFEFLRNKFPILYIKKILELKLKYNKLLFRINQEYTNHTNVNNFLALFKKVTFTNFIEINKKIKQN